MTHISARLARLGAALAVALLPVVATPGHADETVGELTVTFSPDGAPAVSATPGTLDPATHVAAVQGAVEGLEIDADDCAATMTPGSYAGVGVSDCAGTDLRLTVSPASGGGLTGIAIVGTGTASPARTYTIHCDVDVVWLVLFSIKCKFIVSG